MEKEFLAKLVTSVVKSDMAAGRAYMQVIDEVRDDAIKKKLESFHNDHERHIAHLSQVIGELGEQAPEEIYHVRGMVRKELKDWFGSSGTEGAIKSIWHVERRMNHRYKKALSWDPPEAVKETLQAFYHDEQQHLEYIQELLAKKPWREKQTGARR